MTAIGPGLQIAREAAGLSQRRAAERLGVPKSTLDRWEKSRGQPPLDVLIRMTEVYGRPLGELSRLEVIPADMDDVELPEALLAFIASAGALRIRLSEVVTLAAGERSIHAQEEQRARARAYDAYEYLGVLKKIREAEGRHPITGEKLGAGEAGLSPDLGLGGAGAGATGADSEGTAGTDTADRVGPP